MRKVMLAAIVGLSLGWALPRFPREQPGHGPLTMETQGGAIATLPDCEESQWLATVQAEANRRQEAIAVTQDGRLVVLVNPGK